MTQSSNTSMNLDLLLKEYGGLHDAVIEDFQLLPEDTVVKLSIDDLYSNYRGLPGHEGDPVAAKLVIRFHEIVLNLDNHDPGLKIYDCEVERKDTGDILTILFSPSGRACFLVDSFDIIRLNEH